MNQLALFHIPEPRMVIVQPFDKSSMANIEKAIRNSDLGVNPSNDGNIIRVVFPELSEERRKDFIKVARHKAEDSRVSIRNIRRHAKDSLDKLVKAGEAGEDEVHRAERELDELTHTYVGQVDELLRHKEAELLEVEIGPDELSEPGPLRSKAASPGRTTGPDAGAAGPRPPGPRAEPPARKSRPPARARRAARRA